MRNSYYRDILRTLESYSPKITRVNILR